ncbi:MAG TPA: K+ channel TrkA-N [Hyphomonadaceae bacterium]|nr:K+ channel TrkA-N [Hyphomonadaceae bacterium]
MPVLIQNLAVASAMVALTVTIHFFGLLGLLYFLRRRGERFRAHESTVGQGALILFLVFGIFTIHTAEIWLYAVFYYAVGALGDFEAALYFSTVVFSAVGFGDIVLNRDWRLVSAIEAANGVILLAWSTAFLLSLMARLRSLEHDWLER